MWEIIYFPEKNKWGIVDVKLGANYGFYDTKEYAEYILAVELLGEKPIPRLSINDLLNKIFDSTLRREMEIYVSIASGKYVGDDDIDFLFNTLMNGLMFYFNVSAQEEEVGINLMTLENFDKLGLTNQFKQTWLLFRDAKTRGDKVIAIDSAMHLQHDAGGVETLPIVSISISDDDYALMMMILDILGR